VSEHQFQGIKNTGGQALADMASKACTPKL